MHTLWNLVAITQYGGAHVDQIILIGLAVLAGGFGVAVTWPGISTRATELRRGFNVEQTWVDSDVPDPRGR